MNTPKLYRLYLFSEVQHPLCRKASYEIRGARTQDAIIRVANAAWDLGTHAVLSPLARIITVCRICSILTTNTVLMTISCLTRIKPLSDVYCTNSNAKSIHYVLNQSRTTFLWLRAHHLVAPADLARSKYAIAFNIECAFPYQSLCLAYVIGRFSEQHIIDAGNTYFPLVSLCFSFTDAGVYGALFYGDAFEHVFNQVHAQSLRGNPSTHSVRRSRVLHCAVTRWPSSEDNKDVGKMTTQSDLEHICKGIVSLARSVSLLSQFRYDLSNTIVIITAAYAVPECLRRRGFLFYYCNRMILTLRVTSNPLNPGAKRGASCSDNRREASAPP